jgi:predicted  nucleic acid-binding Zn-ribbon protein
VLFQQNFHQLQNAFNAHNISSNMTHSMTATSSCMSNDVLPPQLKSQNELLTTKVIEMEHKIHNYEVALKEKQADNDKLTEKYEHVLGQMQDFETELTLNKMKLQQVQNNQAQAKSSEEEVERAARIAFGQFDEDVGDSSRSNQDVEVKLVESNNKIQQLEKKLAKMQRDIEKYQKSLTAMEKEKKEADSKIVECSKAILVSS